MSFIFDDCQVYAVSSFIQNTNPSQCNKPVDLQYQNNNIPAVEYNISQ